MKVSEIMTSNVQFINKSKTVHEAAKVMKDKCIGAIPVEDNNKLVGMITDRDIAINLVAQNKAPSTCTVSECMNEGIKYCFEDDDIKDVTKQMSEFNIRRMPVMSREKKLVGIVTLGDIIFKEESAEFGAKAVRSMKRTN